MIKNESESRKEGSERKGSLRFGSMTSERHVLSDRFRKIVQFWLEVDGQGILGKEKMEPGKYMPNVEKQYILPFGV